jgi:CheY-like chemotaxis protein
MIENIFVVDDDPIHQRITDIKLKKINIVRNIKAFLDAEDALESLKNNAVDPGSLPDVILLDLNMPIMDGWDFLNEYEEIRNTLSKPIKIYIVTSSIDERDRRRSETFNCISGYVTKPLQDTFLKQLI